MVGSAVVSSSLLGAAAGDLVLRVCGPSRHGQVVRLKSAKCTVGAEEHCTLRLRSRGVGPMHCLILRGPDRTVVRRWSPDTRLNGLAFLDADLHAGDRLSVAAIDLEVIETGTLVRRVEPEAPQAEQQSQINQRATDLDARAADLAVQRAALDQDRQHWQEERHNEVGAQRRQLEEQQQQRQAEQAEQQSQINQRATDLDARAADLAVQRAALDQDRQHWQEERQNEVGAQRRQLEEQQQQWQAEQAAQQSQINQRATDLDARAADLAVQRAALEQDRQHWEKQQAEAQQQLAHRAEQLDSLRAESEAAERPRSRRSSDAAPVDLAAVFRKIGAEGVLSEESPDEEQRGQKPPPGRLGESRSMSVPQAKDVREDDDESVDDYMARLMKRHRSTTGGSEPSEVRPEAVRPNRPSTAAPDSDASPVESFVPAAPPRRKPAEMTPRAVAAEKHGGLSAMRELANISAHHALSRYARRQMLQTTRGKLLVSLTGVAAGGLLLWLWSSWGASTLTYYTALVGFLVAVVWGVQHAVLTGWLIIGKSGRLKWQSAKQSEPVPASDDEAGDEPAPAEEQPASGAEATPP